MRQNSWSYSVLKDYEACPHRLKLKLDGAPTPAFEENRGTIIHRQAEEYIKGQLDELPRDLRRFEEMFERYRNQYPDGITVEEEWGFTPDWEPTSWRDAWLRVKTDLYETIDATTTRIVDWKTGKSYQNNVPHMQQAQFYALGAFIRHPSIEAIETQFVYLDEGKVTTKLFTRERDFPRLYDNLMQRATAMFFDEEFKPKPNRMNCRFCKYSPNPAGSNACPFGVPWEM